ncbi:hybrid sensor histidine kinase/response regulator [Acuticoccus mangrovi]|uniref:histidine kinase n=1 Tax=Acuticoccus mangrovi TaxID=2796142 RepID=A0A934IMC9_9HYPH|nr:PAS domain-containing protein [Acuticoccus mangrovi]MBJ3774054.1 PAS domain-containing protein [Acuticoccus mangrovi]
MPRDALAHADAFDTPQTRFDHDASADGGGGRARDLGLLLDAVEAINAAASTAAAVAALLHAALRGTGAGGACLMRPAADDLIVTECAGSRPLDKLIGGARHLLGGVCRVDDLAGAAWWAGRAGTPSGGAAPRSWLSAPLRLHGGETALLVSTSVTVGAFGMTSEAFLARAASLAGQAIANRTACERNTLLAAVIDGSSVSVVIADAQDPDRRLIYVNPAFERMTGYGRAEVLGRNCRFLAAEGGDAHERARLRDVVAAGGSGTFTLLNRKRSGELFYNDLTLYPIPDETGATRYLVATQVDGSQRHAVEAERDTARDRLAIALSSIPAGFLLLDEHDRIVFANEPFRRAYPTGGTDWQPGEPYREAMARHGRFTGLDPAAGEALAARRLAAMRTGAAPAEAVLCDGRVARISGGVTPDGGALAIVVDITREKQHERLLAERIAAVDAAQDAIAVLDEIGAFVYVNPAFRSLYAIADAVDVVGTSWRTLFAEENAEDLLARAAPALEARGVWRGEVVGRRADGRTVEQELAITRLDGDRLICIGRDITERRRAEMERAHLLTQLARAQRQEAIGVIAAGLAHDLNNVASVVTGSAGLIAEAVPPGSAERRHADRIAQAGRSMSDLISRLLNFGKRAPTRGTAELGAVVAEAMELVRTGLDKTIAVRARRTEEAVTVLADPTEVLQVILNLAFNARDAVDQPGGEIHLAVRQLPRGGHSGIDDCGVVVGTHFCDRPYGCVCVTDNGRGIDQRHFGDVFRPYYSTKGAGGTGLGLAVVAGIVRAVGGFVHLASSVGEGATFSVCLPVVDPDGTPSPRQPEPRAPLAPPNGASLAGRLVLVLDDDPVAGEVVAATLEAAGAEAAVCQNAVDALAALADDRDAWDLLVTDLAMPGRSGVEVAEAARRMRPGLPILLHTGRTDWPTAVERPEIFDDIVPKGADPGDVTAAAARLIERASPPPDRSDDPAKP